MGIERRDDIQLVALKHTESISELELIQRLMINCKKIHGLFCVWFFLLKHLFINTVQRALEPPPCPHKRQL